MLRRIHSENLNAKEIIFKNGLNIILGDDNGSNSIGKTTSMKLINHVFGGKMIVNNEELQSIYPDLIINFEFCFNNESYYYSRSISDKEEIKVCNPDYSIKRTIKIDQFRSLMKERYGIRDQELSFLAASKFTTRIWDKNNQDKLLQEHGKITDAVNDLLKIFDEYRLISDHNKTIDEYNNQINTSKNILKRDNIPITSIKRQLEQNESKRRIIDIDIQQLKVEIESARKKPYVPTLEEIQYQDTLRNLRKIAEEFEFKKVRLTANIFSDDKQTKQLIEELHIFFPELDYKHLSEIEQFHHNINKYLSDEIKSEIKKCDYELTTLRSRIEETQAKYNSIKTNGIDEESIDKLTSLIKELGNIDKIISELNSINEYSKKKKSLEQSIKDEKETIYKNLETIINTDLKHFNEEFYGPGKTSPHFNITKRGSYEYKTSNDSGTGRTYVNTIMFDQVLLNRTDAPYLIHDSYMFNHIEPGITVKLLQNYNETKQSFISIDSHEVFDPQNKALFEDKVCLKLDAKNTLMDKKWNINKNDVEDDSNIDRE